MNISGTFEIEKSAKSKGGDRYKGQLSNDFHSELSTVYIPQTISRGNEDRPYRRIKIKISSNMEENAPEIPRNDIVMVSCHLKKTAKAGGGDRYDGKVNDEMLSIYISQCFSRIRQSKLTSNALPVKEALVIFQPTKSPLTSSSGQVSSSPSISSSRQNPIKAASLVKRERPSCYSSEHDQGISKRGKSNRFVIDVDDDEGETKSRNDQGIQKRGKSDCLVIDADHDEAGTKLSNPEIITLDPEDDERTSLPGVDLKAYLHEQHDDALIEKISDSSGNFCIETYLKIRMASDEFS